MPNKIDKDFLEALKTGIAAIETGGIKNPYSSPAGDKNKDGKPDSSAMGKYQFLKSFWWETKDTGGIKGFKDFAKGKPDLYGKVEKWEDVEGNKALQEAYFAYYAENHLIPKAKAAIAKGNPLNLTLGQAVAVMHKNGAGAGRTAITTGKLNDSTSTNVSDAKYLKTFDGAIKQNGLKDVMAKDYIAKEAAAGGKLGPEEKKIVRTSEQALKDVIEKDKNISKLYDEGVTADIVEEKRAELFQEVKAEGLTAEFDQHIDAKNAEVANRNELLQLFAGAETQTFLDKDKKKSYMKSITSEWKDAEEIKALVEKFPEYKDDFHVQNSKNGLARVIVNRKHDKNGGDDEKSMDRFLTKFNKDNAAVFGEEYEPIKSIGLDTQLKTKSTGVLDDLGKVGSGILEDFKNTVNFLDGKAQTVSGNISTGSKTQYVKQDRSKIDWNKVEVPEQEARVVHDDDEANAEKEREKALTPHVIGGIIADSENSKGDAEGKKSEGEDVENPADAYLKLQNGILGALDKDGMSYNKKDYKQDLPIDSVTGLALGLIGNDQAKNADIPLRNEDIGEAVKAYTSELARRSKEGLPPEVMAAIDNKLAEAYQGGLESIRNTAGGNSALILGNQGTLENAKSKGLVNAQLANYEAKEKAFQQYGQAIQYIDQVRMNRDIANTTMRQRQGIQDKADGEQLAAAGFAKMIDGIKYQKENGPGSANHMYKSALMQKMFGFDPAMKDDGTGKAGTRSAFLAQKEEYRIAQEENTVLTEDYNSLNKDARSAIGSLLGENPTGGRLRQLVDEYKVKRDPLQPEVDQYATERTTTEEDLLNPEPASALATTPGKPEVQNKGQVGGINTGLGFIPNTLLGTEPTAIAPTVDIAAQAMSQANPKPNTGSGLAGQPPIIKTPEMPTFNEPKTDLDSALATSVQNQSNYYQNQ